MRVVVTGLVATYPVGGVAWDYLQYVEGFRRLGCDVFYVEDTGQWFYDPDARTFVTDATRGARYLADALQTIAPGFGDAYKQMVMNPITSVGLVGFGETLPRFENFVELDPAGTVDAYGIPVLKITMAWGENEQKMIPDMAVSASEMMETAGAQCLMLTGFFEDQMRGRHNIRWYADLGATFFRRAAAEDHSPRRAQLLDSIGRRFEFWRQSQARLSHELRDLRYVLTTQPEPPATGKLH